MISGRNSYPGTAGVRSLEEVERVQFRSSLHWALRPQYPEDYCEKASNSIKLYGSCSPLSPLSPLP
eukprot:619842-Rhodomonas_salina.1